VGCVCKWCDALPCLSACITSATGCSVPLTPRLRLPHLTFLATGAASLIISFERVALLVCMLPAGRALVCGRSWSWHRLSSEELVQLRRVGAVRLLGSSSSRRHLTKGWLLLVAIGDRCALVLQPTASQPPCESASRGPLLGRVMRLANALCWLLGGKLCTECML
jgi:hypothetical protein